MELRLVIGQLEEFAKRVSQELQEPDWDTRREVVRALVKKVEIDEQEVRIVYRVSPSPFEGGPQQGSLQHCWGHENSSFESSLIRPSSIWIETAVDDRTGGGLGPSCGREPTPTPFVSQPRRANGTRIGGVGKMGEVLSPR